MKRSQINAAMVWAVRLLEAWSIRLPDPAYWAPDEWRRNKSRTDVIRKAELGWDITDFGTGDFRHVGAVLYTVRNGVPGDAGMGVPYCEKYILMEEGQRLPRHYHVMKTEDIINRAGGVLSVFLWNTDDRGRPLDSDVTVYRDGVQCRVRAGEELLIRPGNSVTLTPRMAHVFGPKEGYGPVIAGEVSKVNDDHADNFFLEPIARFARIEEDEPMLHPLCTEYDAL